MKLEGNANWELFDRVGEKEIVDVEKPIIDFKTLEKLRISINKSLGLVKKNSEKFYESYKNKEMADMLTSLDSAISAFDKIENLN